VNAEDHYEETPLAHYCSICKGGMWTYGVISILIDEGAHVDTLYLPDQDPNGDTPLHVLIRNGMVQIVRELLDLRPEMIHYQNRRGKLPRDLLMDTALTGRQISDLLVSDYYYYGGGGLSYYFCGHVRINMMRWLGGDC